MVHNDPTRPPWLRPALVILGAGPLASGLWAVIAPRHWYDNFPGWAPRLVSALPPFNEHLATDAGAGLLATGVLALIAAAATRRTVVATAMAGSLAFHLPHALFHITHTSPAMSTAENAVNSGGLIVVVAVAVAVLAWSVRATAAPALAGGQPS